jgi:hypothetical protein
MAVFELLFFYLAQPFLVFLLHQVFHYVKQKEAIFNGCAMASDLMTF